MYKYVIVLVLILIKFIICNRNNTTVSHNNTFTNQYAVNNTIKKVTNSNKNKKTHKFINKNLHQSNITSKEKLDNEKSITSNSYNIISNKTKVNNTSNIFNSNELNHTVVKNTSINLFYKNNTQSDLSDIQTTKFDKSFIKIWKIDKPVREHIYCGIPNKIVLIVTESNDIYRSEDLGYTWIKLHPKLDEYELKQSSLYESILVTNIKQSPIDPNQIVIIGYKGYSWISSDCGKSLFKFTQKILDYIYHPFENKWAISLTLDKTLILTLDNGQTWKKLGENVVQAGWGCYPQGKYSVNQSINELLSNKKNSNIFSNVPKQRILMTSYPRSTGKNIKYKANNNSISLNKYNANIYTNINNNNNNYNEINQTKLPNNDIKSLFVNWTYKIDFVYSDDFFETTVAAVQKGNKFILTTKYLFVAMLLDEETQEVGLLVADPNQERYIFNEVLINIRSISSRSYIFLDTNESAVFIHINEFGSNSSFGNIYISGGLGGRYVLSLEYNIRNKNNQCDFESIQGIEGVFIANVIDKNYIENNYEDLRFQLNLNLNSIQDTIIQEDAKQDFSNNLNNNWFTINLLNHIQTKITYNKGGLWNKLYPPNKSFDGNKIRCKDITDQNYKDNNYKNDINIDSLNLNNIKDNVNKNNSINNNDESCSLNLHGVSSIYPVVYSVKSAIGMILGNGNIGKYLSYDEDLINTYISKDAGNTWFEILNGPHLYQIGDSGGIIVFAKFNQYTDHVLYTLDQGLTFKKVYFNENLVNIEYLDINKDNQNNFHKVINIDSENFNDNISYANSDNEKSYNTIRLKVINIATTPENKSLSFTITGKSHHEGINIYLDFKSLNLRNCNENNFTANLFSNKEYDFEKWVPSSAFNLFNSCLMGKKTEYIRKKSNAICVLGENYIVKSDSHSCSCKAEDYECDIGFIRKGLNCIKETIDPNIEIDIFSPPDICYDTYKVTKGYRRIPGNQCTGEGIIEYEPIIMYCPNNIFSLTSSIIFFTMFFGIIILFVLAFSKRALKCFKYTLGYYKSKEINFENMKINNLVVNEEEQILNNNNTNNLNKYN